MGKRHEEDTDSVPFTDQHPGVRVPAPPPPDPGDHQPALLLIRLRSLGTCRAERGPAEVEQDGSGDSHCQVVELSEDTVDSSSCSDFCWAGSPCQAPSISAPQPGRIPPPPPSLSRASLLLAIHDEATMSPGP